MARSLAWALVVCVLVVSPGWAKRPTARINQLGRLAGQALRQGQVERGEKLLDEAVATGRTALLALDPQVVGEYPLLLNAYLFALQKRLKISAARKRYDEVYTGATAGLDLIETLIAKLSVGSQGLYGDLIQGYYDTLGRAAWACTVQEKVAESLAVCERGLGLLEKVLAALPPGNAEAVARLLERYAFILGKMKRDLVAQGKEAEALAIIRRGRTAVVAVLGAEHAQAVAFLDKLEATEP